MPYKADETKLTRLSNAFEFSRTKLRPFREKRTHAIKQYIGANFSDDGANEKVPVNLLEMAINIYRRQVAARRPRVVVTTRDTELASKAYTFELALNALLEDIRFEDTVQRWTLDAMFGLGIIKVGISPGNVAEINGHLHDSGKPFADVVDFEDFVLDMTARRWDEIQFCGNRYVLPHEAVMDTKMFGNKDIQANEPRAYNEGGDERLSQMTSGTDWYRDRSYMPVVELWDLWLPYENVCVTIQADDDGGISGKKILRVVEWEGPEVGPYHHLSYGDVPGSLLPLSPASLLLDMHELSNRVFRKLGRQADRQKTVTVVAGGADEDGKRVVRANDGDTIRSDRPEATKELKFGGIDNASLGFMIQLKDLYSYLGGNLDSLGGLGKAADTVGQEKLISQTSAMKIVEMQERTTKAVRKVIHSLGDYLWYDPVAEPTVIKTIPNTDFSVPVKFGPKMREGEFVNFNLDIAPYSMQDRTPAERLQTLSQTMTNFIIPLAPQLQQQGVAPDMNKFLEIISKYSDSPEIAQILKPFEMPEEQQGAGERPTQSPVTTRTNVRRNESGGTRSGQDQEMAKILAASGQEQPDMSQMGMGG